MQTAHAHFFATLYIFGLAEAMILAFIGIAAIFDRGVLTLRVLGMGVMSGVMVSFGTSSIAGFGETLTALHSQKGFAYHVSPPTLLVLSVIFGTVAGSAAIVLYKLLH